MSGHAAYALVLLGIEDSSLRSHFTRRENTFRQVVGNLRFPLTLTYHGCPGLFMSPYLFTVQHNTQAGLGPVICNASPLQFTSRI